MESQHSHVLRSELAIGWRFAPWVSIEASVFAYGGTTNTALTEVVWALVRPVDSPPGPMPSLQRDVIRSTLHRRISGVAVGPTFTWQVSPSFRWYTRQDIARVAEKVWGYYPIINVGNDPGISIWAYPQPPFEFSYRRIGYRGSVGLDWSSPEHSRWSVGAEVGYAASSLVQATDLLAKTTFRF